MAERVYAIGDIHGHRAKLRAAHALVMTDRDRCGDAAAPLVHLGDLCDRGPDSAGVIEDLLAGLEAGEPWHVLRGNHDQMFSDLMELEDEDDPRAERADLWLSPNIGGRTTLASYGIAPDWGRSLLGIQAEVLAGVPAEHRTFLRDLPFFYQNDDLFCVHAGIRPGVPLDAQAEEDLIWIRYDFLEDRRDHGKLIVHGHTPAEFPEHHGNRVNLDTGAGFGLSLTAAVFEGRDGWVLAPDGRVPL